MKYLLFRFDHYDCTGGMNDCVGYFDRKDKLMMEVDAILNDDFDSDNEHLHYYNTEENTITECLPKVGVRTDTKDFRIIESASLGEMSGLNKIKNQMDN